MSTLRDVFQWIDDSREKIYALQRDLTSRPALSPVNGGQGEHEKAEYLKARLEALSPDVLEEIKAPDEKARDGYRPNLMALWKGEARGPKVWVLSHMDIVPPGDLSLWDGANRGGEAHRTRRSRRSARHREFLFGYGGHKGIRSETQENGGVVFFC